MRSKSTELRTRLFSTYNVTNLGEKTARCPIAPQFRQVMAFLNRLFKTFDNRIDRFDVYKVEAVETVYMCASGLPHRNGTKDICNCNTMQHLLWYQER